MKFLFIVTFCFSALLGSAQDRQPYPASDSIVITGLVKKSLTLSVKDFSKVADTSFTPLKIVNHKGEFKNTYQQLKAVLLRKLLADNLQSSGKPRDLNSFYFVLKATDGYTAVYSYTELFNPPLDAVYLVTGYDGVEFSTMPERPIVMSLTGPGTAKFGMRGLKSIEVRKAE